MPIRIALIACALVLGTLATVTSASAGDPYGGFGPSDTDTQEIGSDPNTGGATPDDSQNMESIQQQTQDQQDTYGSAGSQQDAVEQGEDNQGADNDVEDGH
jgi:hypothetical protein